MAYRFVHAADVHLDSPLRSLALRNPELAELIGGATRRALSRIVDLCLDEQVDALLLAGDLYDGDQTSMKTARFLAEEVRRLHEAGVRAFIIRGNHDALSRITRELVFPPTVKVFGGRAEVAMDERSGHVPVAIHGLSFSQPHAPECLLGKFKPAVDGAVNIGIMHTSLAGAAGHDPYAPCSLADLQGAGFRYWALGHVHKRSVVKDGACAIVMPGMPQGRDINEAGAKSVTLVTIGDDRSIRIEERATGVAQFERVSVDATRIEDWRNLLAAVERALERTRTATPSQHLVARLRIAGATPLAWRIRRDLDLLKAEIDARASLVGACWVEKIEADCRPPGEAGASGDPLGELRRLIQDEVLGSDAFRAELAGVVDELRTQLPPECRDSLGADEVSAQAGLGRFAREGAEDVLARLQAAEGA